MKESFRSKFKVSITITKFYRRFLMPNVLPHNRVMRINIPDILSYSYINNRLLDLIKQKIISVNRTHVSCHTKEYISKRMTTSLILRRLCKFNFEIVDDHIYKNLSIYYQSTNENHIVSILLPTLRELEKIGYLIERLPDEF